MHARGVVIAEMTTGSIIRTLLEKGFSRCIYSVDIPCEGLTERLFSRHRIEGNALIVIFPTLFIHVNAAIKDTVSIVMFTEYLHKAGNSVRSIPVITVEKADYIAGSDFQSLVSRYGRTLVCGVSEEDNAIVTTGIIGDNGCRAVGGSIVYADDFQIGVGLGKERIKATGQGLPGIIYGY